MAVFLPMFNCLTTTFLNELLLEKGFAYADIRFKHQFLTRYPQLESLARNNKTGLWQNM